MEPNLPMIQSQIWHVAKDTAFAAEYEDAAQVQDGRAAIADGVSTAIFSGRWARILTKRAVEAPPDISQSDGWIKWLVEPRRLWLDDIDFPRMPVHQKNKLRQVGGSFSTLCWIEFYSLPRSDGEGSTCHLRSFALGDSCLLHIRSGELLKSFPLTTSSEFDLDPDSICSVATSRDERQPLATTDFECLEGDRIVLVTDAIAKWMLLGVENGDRAPWEELWSLDEANWIVAIERLRDANIMKRDDTTMVVLQVGDEIPPWLQSTPAVAEIGDPQSIQEQECNDLNAESLVVFAEYVVDDAESAGGRAGDIPGVCGIENNSTSQIETANDISDATLSEVESPALDEREGPIGV